MFHRAIKRRTEAGTALLPFTAFNKGQSALSVNGKRRGRASDLFKAFLIARKDLLGIVCRRFRRVRHFVPELPRLKLMNTAAAWLRLIHIAQLKRVHINLYRLHRDFQRWRETASELGRNWELKKRWAFSEGERIQRWNRREFTSSPFQIVWVPVFAREARTGIQSFLITAQHG